MLRRNITIIVLGFLTACGGGGGGSSDQHIVSTLTFQFKSAWGAYQQQPSVTYPFTLSGTASNATLGSYAITGSGSVTQTSGTSTQPALNGGGTVTAIMVTRVYQFTALVHGISIPQTLTDVAYYDPTSYAYMGGYFTDNTGSTIYNFLVQWSPPADTLACCSTGMTNTFYTTNTGAASSPLTHNYLITVAADTANSIFVNLTDTTAAGANRSYRLDYPNTLTPVTENINMAALVMVNGSPYLFNGAVTFHY